MTGLDVTLVQAAADLDPARNRDALGVVADVADGTDLVVFPEAFMRDFGQAGSDVAEFAEPLDGPFVKRLTELAREHEVMLLAGMFEVSDDPARPFNTLVLVDEAGLRASYRKIHLYDSFGYRESDRLSAGLIEPVVAEVGAFNAGLMTCYDLRFPELARGLVDKGADLLVVPAAWVAGPRKVEHWRAMVIARAIENTAFVVAVGQPGPRYSGHSMVVAPNGEVLVEAGEEPCVLDARLEAAALRKAREDNPSLANRRM